MIVWGNEIPDVGQERKHSRVSPRFGSEARPDRDVTT